jgi:radical SAM protein with 4Fe4S-binding SPASM domain
MPTEGIFKQSTTRPCSTHAPHHRWEVELVGSQPALPGRLASVECDSQCDCACYALEGNEVPLLSAPISFYLELTPDCNNRCPGCGNAFVERGGRAKDGRQPRPLDAAGWRRILDRLGPHALRLKLTGGEPTLHPQFEAIVTEVAGLGIPFTLFTNGRWQRPARTVCLLHEMDGCQGLLVSLHGATARAHEAFSGVPGSFAETLATVRLAIAGDLPVSLSCVITHWNWRQVDDMLALARRLNVQSVVFNRYVGPAQPQLVVTDGQLAEAAARVATLRAVGHPVKLGNCLPTCFMDPGQAGCLAGLAFFSVDPWGQVRPCNHAPLICGNLLESSVEEIWQSPEMQGWRSSVPAGCATCPSLPTCRGGCRAQAMLLGLKADPLMQKAQSPRRAAPERVAFYREARPVGLFQWRQEAFGSVLMHGNRLLAVGPDQEVALGLLDGSRTLHEIESTCGPKALSLIANLYHDGMVEFLT